MKKLNLKQTISERNQTPVNVARVRPLVKDIVQIIKKLQILEKEDDISQFLQDAHSNLHNAAYYLESYIKVHGK